MFSRQSKNIYYKINILICIKCCKFKYIGKTITNKNYVDEDVQKEIFFGKFFM